MLSWQLLRTTTTTFASSFRNMSKISQVLWKLLYHDLRQVSLLMWAPKFLIAHFCNFPKAFRSKMDYWASAFNLTITTRPCSLLSFSRETTD